MSMELETCSTIEKEKKKKKPFHPSDQPHGSKNYDLDALEFEQIKELKDKKLLVRQENEIYLKNHPEIRGLISILLRYDSVNYFNNIFKVVQLNINFHLEDESSKFQKKFISYN